MDEDKMQYSKVIEGIFIERPNRFIAMVDVNGSIETCHVKNTGRCKELLLKGVRVFLEEHDNPKRKTKYSLVAVMKGNRLVNIDSQAPNKVVEEWLRKGILFPDVSLIQAEKKYGNSRFDFYLERDSNLGKVTLDRDSQKHTTRKIFMEVKGVILEDKGVVRFPDAPTERGLKHIHELTQCLQEGYDAYVIFVIQMKDVAYFEPNNATHAAFGAALKEAQKAGVQILAYDCHVGVDCLEIAEAVEVVL